MSQEAWTIIGAIVGILSLLGMYHLAIVQGLFKKNSVYLGIINPFSGAVDNKKRLSRPTMVLYGIPKDRSTTGYLLTLPVLIENNSNEATKNIKVSIGYDNALNDEWTINLLTEDAKSIREENAVRVEVAGAYITHYLLDVLRIGEHAVINHPFAFKSELLGKSRPDWHYLQDVVLKDTGMEIYVSPLQINVVSENAKEKNLELVLLVTDCESKEAFKNDCIKLCNSYYKNMLRLSLKHYIAFYIAQKIYQSGFIQSTTLINYLNFPAVKNGHFSILDIEDITETSVMWMIKKHKLVSPLELYRQRKAGKVYPY